MDPFDDILPGPPVARSRAGGKFIPKAKSKQLPRKEISASEHIASCNDGTNEHVALSSASTNTIRPSQNEYDTTSPKLENFQPVNANRDDATLVDALPSTIAVPEVNRAWNSTGFPKSASEENSTSFDADLGTNTIPMTNLRNENVLGNVSGPSATSSNFVGTEGPFKNWEGSLFDGKNNLEPPDTSLLVSLDVASKKGPDLKDEMFESNIPSNSSLGAAGEVEQVEFEVDPFSNVLPESRAGNARKFQPKIKPRPKMGTVAAVASDSPNLVVEKSFELPASCTNEVQSFQSTDGGSGGLTKPTSSSLPVSEILGTTDPSSNFDYTSSSIPFSDDNRRLGAVSPCQPDSLNTMLPQTRDWPSNFEKSSGEVADIFSGLECFDDFLAQSAMVTEKSALHAFNEKGTEENFVIPTCSHTTTQDPLAFKEAVAFNEGGTDADNGRSETESQEVLASNPGRPIDDVLDYSSIKSGPDPPFEIPEHEGLTNAAAGPTLGDLLLAEDIPGPKTDAGDKDKGATMSTAPRKHENCSTAEKDNNNRKALRQTRKRTIRKASDGAESEAVEDDDDLDPLYNCSRDELEENDDECGADHSSKNKRASTTSKKKSVTKSRKQSGKHKEANGDLEESSKKPPKRFSHSTRRKKRCVDKALLETPEDELDPRTLPMKDIILLAEYRERLKKKEAVTSQTASINQSGRDSFHDAATNDEEEDFGSEDGRASDDDQAIERVSSASTLINYRSFMDKTPSGKWSKQDTELFYQAVREFGTDFSMIQQLFPGRTRHQVKLKYKKEERQHPLRLSEAMNNRAKERTHFKILIERLQQASTRAEQEPASSREEDPVTDASVGITGEEAGDMMPETNDEGAKPEPEATVKDQDDSVPLRSPEKKSDESEDDDYYRWSQYKSDY
ncbi:hypothetical protein L6164_035356 [Bauhinia variegata]|uniref:Uncharacterized protein n=1 Tax=Bauhinia variegata TaxID=167791 RepID=A0ACB9KDP9_BAUVA|nr:hypothetical protein L6164_035356 [Bauhinia variegata]